MAFAEDQHDRLILQADFPQATDLGLTESWQVCLSVSLGII